MLFIGNNKLDKYKCFVFTLYCILIILFKSLERSIIQADFSLLPQIIELCCSASYSVLQNNLYYDSIIYNKWLLILGTNREVSISVLLYYLENNRHIKLVPHTVYNNSLYIPADLFVCEKGTPCWHCLRLEWHSYFTVKQYNDIKKVYIWSHEQTLDYKVTQE